MIEQKDGVRQIYIHLHQNIISMKSQYQVLLRDGKGVHLCVHDLGAFKRAGCHLTKNRL